QRVHEISGGNPLYALALGTELTRGSLEDWRELPIPNSLGDAIARRLERVRTGVEAPLFAVAALAEPTVGVVGAALDEFAVADLEERALHLALGTREPDEDVARELERAASLAARRGAPEAAAELLEHAIRLTPVDQDQARWTRMVTAAERHLAGGDFAAAR